ncbi:MAG: hypothetical protein KME26_05545 [Oscillatoria princeps RMCB-10]|nr:hypothetical protein [Oscillatoria princeps RMCB-10]
MPEIRKSGQLTKEWPHRLSRRADWGVSVAAPQEGGAGADRAGVLPLALPAAGGELMGGYTSRQADIV